MGTTTIHRCSECNHSSVQHEGGAKYRCSHGFCPCERHAGEVEAVEPEITIPTWPGYDRATGRWAER